MVAGRRTGNGLSVLGFRADPIPRSRSEYSMAFFRPGPGPYALAVVMTGVRLGERLLEIGSGTPDLFGALAVKTGLSGHAAGVDDDRQGAAALTQAGAQAGALVEVEVA